MIKRYCKLCLKRNLKIYPNILVITLLTLLSIAITCSVLMLSNLSDEKKQKFSLGIVGNMQDTYLDIGLNVLQNADSSRLYIEWIELDSEDEAKKALESRKISGYVHIPNNYMSSILSGNNIPAKFVMLSEPEGFGTIIFSEVTEIVSNLVVESQTGMFGMQSFLNEYHKKDFNKKTALLMKRYMDTILNREEIYGIHNLGVADSLSFIGYYICSLLLIFMLIWGISCNKVFSSKNTEHAKILNNAGIKVHHQIFAEYSAYLFLTLMTVFLLGVIFGVIAHFIHVDVPELLDLGVTSCIGYLIKILPVIIMITMMQYAFYELIPNTVASILTQFICIILLGYISGCFYPNYFFPKIIQTISSLLPVGAGFSYMRKSMIGLPSFGNFLLVFGYICLFFGISYYSKKYKITGDAK